MSENVKTIKEFLDHIKTIGLHGANVCVLYLPAGEQLDLALTENELNSGLNAYLKPMGYTVTVSIQKTKG